MDAGNYDKEKKWVRYGSRHNDFYKRIGDLLRYKLSLRERNQTKARNQARAITKKNLEEEARKKQPALV